MMSGILRALKINSSAEAYTITLASPSTSKASESS